MTPHQTNRDKTFKLKYHHNLAWDKHFTKEGKAQQ
jgi:hypothetical protein